MGYSSQHYINYLDSELEIISESYLKKLNASAISLLENEEVFLTRFIKINGEYIYNENQEETFQGEGDVILKLYSKRGIPRIGEYFQAVLLNAQMKSYKNWNNISWGKLCQDYQLEFSELHCVWQGKTDEEGFVLVGMQGLSESMAHKLIDEHLQGCIIVLGPQKPPIAYYQNLISFVEEENEISLSGKMLYFDNTGHDWHPKSISAADKPADIIYQTLNTHDDIIIQGPPGTGKTYLMAQIVSELLKADKSVLVTSLTNRALIELAEKSYLNEFINNRKVVKTNVSVGELSELPKLKSIKSTELYAGKGQLTLSTFYNTSGWAKDLIQEQPFDYVIMDESSQALFPMIVACKKLGKKHIWVGDQLQLPPITQLSDKDIIRNSYSDILNGFNTLCKSFNYESFILTDSYRLLPNAAKQTSIFYSVPLHSVAKHSLPLMDVCELAKNDGCSIVYKPMPVGVKVDQNSIKYVVDLVGRIKLALDKVNSTKNKDKTIEIAVLTKFRSTVRSLQNTYISVYGKMNNVLIDTVERVQGMTCDICVYFIPNSMLTMSLEPTLFNVATSRAKYNTILIADPDIVNVSMADKVKEYLSVIEEKYI